jgi:quinol monooxygenase YgiN
MQTAFIARLVVRAERVGEFESLQRELADITHRTEPGTLVYDVLRHRDAPHTYVVYARFRDQAAFDLHQAAPDHDRLVPPILATLAQDMDLQFFEPVGQAAGDRAKR